MKGVYSGTFNPFTIGHADIVRRALSVLDELHVVIGTNILKVANADTTEERVKKLQGLYRSEPRIVVTSYPGIIAKYAKSLGDSAVLIRGIRSSTDLERERSQADTNRIKYGVETLFLLSDPSLSYVSSSLVRELQAFGEDASEFLPSQTEL